MGSKAVENELVELFQKAQKAADKAAKDDECNEAEEQRCLDALKALRSVPVTMALTLSPELICNNASFAISHAYLDGYCEVGKRLRSVTKHPREKIRTLAVELLDAWKKVVASETFPNNGNKATKVEDKHSKTVKVEINSSKGESVKVEINSSKGEFVKVEKKPKVEAESIGSKKASSSSNGPPKPATNGPPKPASMIKCNDALRDKFREILYEAFSKVVNEAEGEDLARINACDPVRVAVSVETLMFEKLGRSNGAQKFKYRSIMFNLKDGNNPDLRRKVLFGEIKPEKLIVMTAEEMASDNRKLENKQIKDKALFECERGMKPKATTDQFKCGKCGQRMCTYYQLQTRSADEPMTTFVTCVNCNNHWKFC